MYSDGKMLPPSEWQSSVNEIPGAAGLMLREPAECKGEARMRGFLRTVTGSRFWSDGVNHAIPTFAGET